MKKLVSLAFVLALTLCLLVSCSTPESQIKKADGALADAPYKITTKLKINCDDPVLQTAFNAMAIEMPLVVDGDNMKMEMNMDVGMGISMDMKLTIVGRALYMDMSVMGETMKSKTTLTDDQYKEFLSENSAEQPLKYDRFETIVMEDGENGETVIKCSGITAEGLAEINKTVNETFEGIEGGSVALSEDSITLELVIKDGKYQSMALNYDFTMVVEGESSSVSAVMESKFDYDNIRAITAPADADQYEDVNYDDMFGN